VRIFSYYNAQGRSRDEWQSESLNRLKRLRDEASRLGLVLYHENERHIFGDLCADVQTIARELRDSPDGVFRLIFDFDNYNQSGEDVWQNWLALRDMTDAIHLKDSRDNQHTPVGQGTGRVREILEDAANSNWRGPMSIEPHLQHSAAIMATGPSGTANQQFANMTQAESFALACRAATDLLKQTGTRNV
jgi:sugar phosphate isomerase/epimerase